MMQHVMTEVTMTKKIISGNDAVGYGRPPKSGQIKAGEVRNPWGKAGKPQRAQDLLLKVAREEIRASVNGRTTSMTQEEAAYRKLFQEVQKGSPTAMKLAMEHLSRRRPPLPPHPTIEELAQQAADEERRKELSARLVQLLQEKAAQKRRSGPPVRYGPDGQPIGTYDPQ
jgi:hypothetical protein